MQMKWSLTIGLWGLETLGNCPLELVVEVPKYYIEYLKEHQTLKIIKDCKD